MNILITGGCGFLGCNLAAAAIAKGDDVTVLDNLSRLGYSDNLSWLRGQGDFNFFHADIRNVNEIERAVAEVGPDAVFQVARKVAVTTSIVDPRRDFEINALGTSNMVDVARRYAPKEALFYSSACKACQL